MQLPDMLSHWFHPRRSNNHRPKLLHAESYLSLIGVTVGFALFIFASKAINPQFGYILGYASDISVFDVVAQTNQERAKAGLAALEYDDTLSQAASAKAADMFAKQYWAHQSPEGKEPWAFINEAGYEYIAAGENLARDFMATPEMIDAWMNSPTHKANIMNPRYQEIGIAVVNGTLQGMETTLVVQMFGRPSTGQVAQVPESAGTTEKPQIEEQPLNIEFSDSEKPLTSQPVLSTTSINPGTLESTDQTFLTTFSPVQLSKTFALALLIVLIATLAYDWYLAHVRGTVRMVGKNSAHIIFFVSIVFIVLLFKGGYIF